LKGPPAHRLVQQAAPEELQEILEVLFGFHEKMTDSF
jgi:hypothetical protein